jgi:ESCRT-II complex subunit VPS36
MVAIAEKIKSALAKHELDADSEELKEIQKVMFNMGIVSDFSTQVSKDTSGKNYHSALAYEIEKFLDSIIQKFGGVIGLVDLYCIYNRARGTDLISPDDLKLACEIMNKSSTNFGLKIYKSGV